MSEKGVKSRYWSRSAPIEVEILLHPPLRMQKIETDSGTLGLYDLKFLLLK